MSDTLTSLTTTVRTSPGVPEGLTVSVNDTDYTNDQLSVSITQLPSDGTLTYVDPNTGDVVELTVGDTITVQELQSLIFTGSVAGAGSLSEMTFTISDPSGDLDYNYNEFMVGPLAGSALPVSVAENAAPVPLDISSPTSEDPYEIIVLEVPTDGTVLLGGNESGSVSAGQILDAQELADLSFMPTPGDFNDFGNFVYRVEDTTTGLVDDAVVPTSIGPAIGNPVVTTPDAAVLDGTVPFPVQTMLATDPNYSSALLTYTIITLPDAGTLTIQNGDGSQSLVTAGETLTADQFADLAFTPGLGNANVIVAFNYIVSDPSGNQTSATQTIDIIAIPPAVLNTQPVIAAENGGAVAIGIDAPISQVPGDDSLTITVTGVPDDGTVSLSAADGGTAVTIGQQLTAEELTSLVFTPTAGAFDASGTFSYSVEDANGLQAPGSVSLQIGPAIGNPVVADGSTTVSTIAPQGLPIAIPTDPNYSSSALTVTITGLPTNGTLQTPDGESITTTSVTLSLAQFQSLIFVPDAGQPGSASDLTYTVTDPDGNAASATETIIVAPQIVQQPAPLVAAENSDATPVGLTAPLSQDPTTITILTLPSDGALSYTDGSGQVVALSVGAVLTGSELASLTFTPAVGMFGLTGTFTYEVTDTLTGAVVESAAVVNIGPAIGNPVASRGTVTTDANGAATLLHLPLAIDPNYAGTRLTYTIDALPANGVLAVRANDGSTQAVTVGEVLTFAQYADLVFTPTTGIGNSETSFTYTVTDPSGNATTATVSLDILEVPPVIPGQPAVSVGINAADVALDIAAPTSQVVGNDALTVTLTALPTNGSVFLADGVTPVTVGEALSIDQLTSLVFSAGPNLFENDSTLSYMVVDADGVASNGTVAIDIGAASGDPSNGAPSGLTVAANSTNDPLGLSVPTDPSFTPDGLTVTITKLPDNGTLSIPSTNEDTPVTVGQTITAAQLSQLVFTPTADTGSTTDFFGYTVSDPAGNTTPGTVTLTVGPLQPTSAVSISGATTIAGSEGTDSSKVIVNTAQPTIAGDQAAGVSVGLLNAAGDVIGGGSVNTDGSFTAVPNTPLGLGLTTIETQSEGYGGAIGLASTPLSLFVIQSQVNGISTTDNSSAQLGSLMDQGYSLQLSAGTEEVQLVDGTLSVGEDTNAALAQRLYEGLLGRSGDTAGIGFYTGLLDQGVSADTVASNILGSAEYQAREGSTTDGQFVDILYQDILGRAPDASGDAFYSGLLQQGVSRGTVAADIANSTEAKTFLAGDTQDVWAPNANGTLLNELYNGAFDRTVDLGGLANYEDALQAGTTPLQIAQTLLSSAEGMADFQGQSDAQFVTSVFENALGRAPGAEGLAFYGGMLSSGAGTRADVLVDVSTSAEAATRLTHSL